MGFDIYANGQTYNVTGTTVYTQITGGTEEKTYKATDYTGAVALFVVVLEDVPTNLTAIQFDVRTYVEYGEEDTVVRSYNSTFEMNNTAFQKNLTAPSPAWATQGGKGTEANPYVLNQNNFVNFYTYYQANAFTTAYFSLESDVEINDGEATDWAAGNNLPTTQFSKSMQAFNGYFNGNGNTLSGVYVSMSCAGNEAGNQRRAALFEQVKGGTVENLRVTNSYFANNVTSASGTGDAGTIACRLNNGSIRNCYSEAIVKLTTSSSAEQLIGGIASMMEGSGSSASATNVTTISNCVFNGVVDASNTNNAAAGGILGRVAGSSYKDAYIIDCLNLGEVSSSTSAGAILGADIGATGTKTYITNCINLSDVDYICYYTTTAAGTLTINTYVITGYGSAIKTKQNNDTVTVTEKALQELNSTLLPGWTFKDGYYPSPIAGLEIACPSL